MVTLEVILEEGNALPEKEAESERARVVSLVNK